MQQRTFLKAGNKEGLVWFLLSLSVLGGIILSAKILFQVWTTGTFFDPDDAMRLVQVRNWLEGQGWFDLRVLRLNPPEGVFLHWSRLVDLPLGGLISFFSLFTSKETAELLTRILFPFLLFLLFLNVTYQCTKALSGPKTLFPALILTVLNGATQDEFQPGRIDHHAPQVVLLLACLQAFLKAFPDHQTCRPYPLRLAGFLMAVSLGISIENLPFIVILNLCLVGLWIKEGQIYTRALLNLGVSLSLGLIGIFFLTIGPQRWFIATCDAFSIAHVVGGVASALALILFAVLSPLMVNKKRRIGAVLSAGLGIGGFLFWTYPACLGDPLRDLDPFLRHLWLDRVSEALGLQALFQGLPELAVALALPLGFACLTAWFLFWKTSSQAKIRWLMMSVLLTLGLALLLWQVRAIHALIPLALVAGIGASEERLQRFPHALSKHSFSGKTNRIDRILALERPLSAFLWRLILPLPFMVSLFVGIGGVMVEKFSSTRALALKKESQETQICMDPQSIRSLRTLPASSLLFAPLDLGSVILAETSHRVFAAPYHRNVQGNRTYLQGMTLPLTQAESLLRSVHPDFIVFCLGLPEVQILKEEAPEGLAAHLARQDIPPWLIPLPPRGPYRLYQLRPLPLSSL